jgi:uncharacterized protein (TIGR02391 family)
MQLLVGCVVLLATPGPALPQFDETEDFAVTETLRSLFPTVEQLLAVSPDDLAPVLLGLARDQGGGMFWPESITQDRSITGEPDTHYPFHKKAQIEALVNEAWDCLRRDGLIAPAPGMNGRNGYMVLTRVGREAAESSDAFERVRHARAFPKAMLHPTIADKAWTALMRGDLGDAVFNSFKAVEEAVRAAGGYAATDIGVELMRMAFNKNNGRLTKPSDPEPEREALAHLFAGAIGSYKNPHSHRTVKLTDPREAQEQVLLASHLLRIVESRKHS